MKNKSIYSLKHLEKMSREMKKNIKKRIGKRIEFQSPSISIIEDRVSLRIEYSVFHYTNLYTRGREEQEIKYDYIDNMAL